MMSGLIERSVVVAALLMISIGGCTPGANLPPMPPYSTGSYKLGAGDQVRVTIYGASQLSGQFYVNDAGDVAMPLIGAVAAAGSTPDELAARLKEKTVSGGFIRNPSVAVEVEIYRPIFVLGEVTKPGQYPFQPGMTMLTAVAIAGGFTYRAVEDYASDTRNAGGQAVPGKVLPNDFLAPGDVIKVYERHF